MKDKSDEAMIKIPPFVILKPVEQYFVNIFPQREKTYLAVWRRNEQIPLTNQHGQSPQPCMAKEKRGNRKHLDSFFHSTRFSSL